MTSAGKRNQAKGTGYFCLVHGYLYVFFALLCVQCLFCLLSILIAVTSDWCWCPGCVRLRALNFVHYARCVKFFTQDDCVRCVSYYSNRRTL